MKIFIDIIHPANIHYFKNFINEMKNENNSIFITCRDKDVSLSLMDSYKFSYTNLGTGAIGKGAIGKLIYLFYATAKFFFLFFKNHFYSKSNKIDISISFGSAPLAFVSWIFRVPHISFDDTEHAKLIKALYIPFSDLVISPISFYSNLGDKHFKFNGFMELFYLHKNRFFPNPKILSKIGLSDSENFTLFRFVSWGAYHDINQKGLSIKDKLVLINEAKKNGKVFISSEGKLPAELQQYELKINPSELHDVLFYAKLYIGEGGTMASECAMLGTPSIYVNSLPLMGYLKEAKKNNLLFHLSDITKIIVKMNNIYNTSNEHFNENAKAMLDKTIDPTAMLKWLVKKYPKSKVKLMTNKNYQNKFI